MLAQIAYDEDKVVSVLCSIIIIAISIILFLEKTKNRLNINYCDDLTRFYMQAIADILKKVNETGLINKKDLYKLKDYLYLK